MGISQKKKDANVKSSLKVNRKDYKPTGFSSPYGDLSYDANGNATYTPVLSAMARQTRNISESKLNDLVKDMPTAWGVNDFYNNPFFESTNRLLQAPIEQQYTQDSKDLLDRLAARNQVGSSYEAYQRDLNSRRFDQLRQQAADSARTQAADAYNMAYTNRLRGIEGLRNDLANAQGMAFQPLQFANQTIQTQMPLRLAMLDTLSRNNQMLGNYYAQQKTRGQATQELLPAIIGALGQAGAAMAGGGGGEVMPPVA